MESQFDQTHHKIRDKDSKNFTIKRKKRGKFELNPHIGGAFSNRTFRKSNLKQVFIPNGDCSYAFSGTHAYLETASRMFGINDIPKFDECLKIATYNGEKEGNPVKSIQLLEDHFKLGIRCEETDNVSYEEALKISIIAKINWW